MDKALGVEPRVSALGVEPQAERPRVSRPVAKIKMPRLTDERTGAVAIVGLPNAGKSTLLNTMLGEHFAIASSKPGTTRNVLLGVLAHKSGAMSFYDTPGLDRPRDLLSRTLLEEAQGAIETVDVIVLLVDATNALKAMALPPADASFLPQLEKSGRPLVLVLNKIDRVKEKAKLLPLMEKLYADGKFAEFVPISALTGDGVPELIRALHKHLPEGPALHQGVTTNRSERFFVTEFVREAVFQQIHAEVPYGCAVAIDEWITDGKRTRISCSIIVAKEAHKGIVIGKGGARLKTIGEQARHSISQFLGRGVHLQTFVKVVPDWMMRTDRVREFTHQG